MVSEHRLIEGIVWIRGPKEIALAQLRINGEDTQLIRAPKGISEEPQ